MEEDLVKGLAPCSMCGDVGIAELLFLCSKCSRRPQHIYCGRSYPNFYGDASICNWCLHEQDSLTTSAALKASCKLLNSCTAKGRRTQVHDRNMVANRPIKALKYPAAHSNEEIKYDGELQLVAKSGHGKAFEYLLLVAAQSLPHVINEDHSAAVKQANHTARLVNDTKVCSPKLGSSDNKANCDLEKTVEMELHSPVNMQLNQRRMDGGVYIIDGANNCKRQRCSKGINGALKCRKKGLQLIPTRPYIYRRYKFLADVVC